MFRFDSAGLGLVRLVSAFGGLHLAWFGFILPLSGWVGSGWVGFRFVSVRLVLFGSAFCCWASVSYRYVWWNEVWVMIVCRELD